jgi:hypothetical protein
MEQRVKKAIKEYYHKFKDWYYEEAEEDVGEFSTEYCEPHGSIRCCDNVDEVEEHALDMFINEFTAKDSNLQCDLFQYLEEKEDETEEEERAMSKYIGNLSYYDVHDFLCS